MSVCVYVCVFIHYSDKYWELKMNALIFWNLCIGLNCCNYNEISNYYLLLSID